MATSLISEKNSNRRHAISEGQLGIHYEEIRRCGVVDIAEKVREARLR